VPAQVEIEPAVGDLDPIRLPDELPGGQGDGVHVLPLQPDRRAVVGVRGVAHRQRHVVGAVGEIRGEAKPPALEQPEAARQLGASELTRDFYK
jgi:hypothetical protein